VNAGRGVLVIGIGNRLRGDDAVGPLVAEAVGRRRSVRAIEHGGAGLSLIDAWQGAETVVLIDAVRSGATAGRVHRIDLIDETLDVSPWTGSTHAFSLAETLELARGLGRLPRRLVFVGVEAATFEIGADLSPAVRDAIPALVGAVAGEIDQPTKPMRSTIRIA
jgi:hydrogenase maturation protease